MHKTQSFGTKKQTFLVGPCTVGKMTIRPIVLGHP